MSPEITERLRVALAAVVREEVARALAERSGVSTSAAEYLCTAEAAELARVAPGTVRRWIREGRLASCGAGREIRVRRAELEELMRPDKKRLPRLPKPRRVMASPEDAAEEMLGI